MAWKKSSDELIEKFYENLEEYPSGELRKMFGYPCSFVNNNMFTGLHEENWIVRLDEEDQEELMKKHGAKPFEPMQGRIMCEYLALPQEIQSDQDLLNTWLEKSYKFVSSMPPKAKKKKKSKLVKSS